MNLMVTLNTRKEKYEVFDADRNYETKGFFLTKAEANEYIEEENRKINQESEV